MTIQVAMGILTVNPSSKIAWHNLNQQQQQKIDKRYNFHSPEVECIAKGKAHNKGK
ncbi:MAG: hypothetical protein HOP36_02040 [Methyloglobulus sp.]|nr:hypothetical protein [Methyloglobulus sp.]